MTWSQLDPGVQLALAGLISAQVLLALVALVVLVRTPRSRLVLGSHWPWAAIILLVGMVGPTVFLAVGRRPAQAPKPYLWDPVHDSDRRIAPTQLSRCRGI